MTTIKTALTKGLQSVFDAEHPNPDLRGIHVSIEWPIEEQHFPGIWVDFEPSDDLTTAGINHIEFGDPLVGGGRRPYRRWRFKGYGSFTISAMSSHERDRLFDAVVKDFAFDASTGGGQFREFVENNPFIAFDISWDEIAQGGMAASMGTPWGTTDTIYEVTLRLGLQGEFVSDDAVGSLLPLNAIDLYPYNDQEPDPRPDGVWQ